MPDPVTGITAGASILGGAMQSDAAGDAADAQTASAEAGIAEQRAAREELRRLLQPYTQAGVPALDQMQALLGLGGANAQQQAIGGIESSPAFMAAMQQGENALLQNASATGGLRGGNVQAALAQFRPQLLAQEIENRYSRLGGLASLGQQSAAGVGTAGINVGSNIGNLLAQQGAAQAGASLAQGQAFGNALGGISQGFGMMQGMGKKFPWQGTPTAPGGLIGDLTSMGVF